MNVQRWVSDLLRPITTTDIDNNGSISR